MYKSIAAGGAFDLANLSSYEAQFDEGDSGLLELDLRLPVSAGVAKTLEDQLRHAGMSGVRVTTASPMLRIYFRKGFPWLAVIAAAILGLIVLAILIVGWRLFKEVIPEGLQPLAGAGLLLLLGLGVVILLKRRI